MKEKIFNADISEFCLSFFFLMRHVFYFNCKSTMNAKMKEQKKFKQVKKNPQKHRNKQ